MRFATDSPYIAVRLIEPYVQPFPHLTICAQSGVSIFADKKFLGSVMPSYDAVANADNTRGGSGELVFDGLKMIYGGEEKKRQVEMFLPLYNGVKEMYVGLKRGSLLESAKDYTYKKPVLFYGSSITQGGCATKPGDDYIGRLCRLLDTEVYNLGYSAGARAEGAIVEYITKQDPSVFVLDYDHNSPSIEHLKSTHYPLYEAVRKAHPETPIIMMTMPTIAGYEKREYNKGRLEVIFETYNRAKVQGDENVYLVDCYGAFGDEVCGECGTVDDIHPDSVGFLRMAERVYPVLRDLLTK